jgi:hypothetical protein
MSPWKDLYLRGYNQRERLAAILAVDAEVGVERPDAGFGLELGHAYQTSVRECHRTFAIAAHEVTHVAVMGMEIKIGTQEANFHERKETRNIVASSLQQEQRF